MPVEKQEDDPSHLSNNSWVKQTTSDGVVDFHKEFVFETSDLSLNFITLLMEIEHHGGEAIIEITSMFQNLTVEVSISSTKKKMAEHLLKLIETTYSKVK